MPGSQAESQFFDSWPGNLFVNVPESGGSRVVVRWWCHGVVGTYSWSWWCGVENEHAVNTILPYLGPSVANVSDGRSCIFCNVLHKWHWQREYAGMKGHETIEHTHMKRVLNRPDLSFLRLE